MATRKSRMKRQSLVKRAMEDKEAEQHLALLFVRDMVKRSMNAMDDDLDDQAKLKKAYSVFDTDGDGNISQEEFNARQDSAEHFSRLGALLFTATAWIFIHSSAYYCFAIP